MCTVDDVINFKTYLQSTSIAMADREKKEGKTEIQKLEYLEDVVSLFLKGYHLVRNTNLVKNSGHKL